MSSKPISLEDECRVFTYYLLRKVPNSYVINKYQKAHGESERYSPQTRFERFTVGMARSHPVLARMADAHARILAPRSNLRQKLVLLLAILESTPPFYRHLETVKGGGPILNFLRLAGYGVVGVTSLLAGTLVFLPVQIVLAPIERGSRR